MTAPHPAAYIRKSHRLADSAAAQLAAVREIAARDGVNGELAIYSDVGVSGRYGKRGSDSEWARLQTDIEAGLVSAVYVSVLDRAGRSLEEWLAFARRCRDHGIRIVDQTGGDRAGDEGYDLTVIEVLFAEREGKKAAERAARGQRTRLARGDQVMGFAPYGFRIAREPETGRIVAEPNPDEPLETVLAAVRESGGNLLQATKRLNADGVPTRNGGIWGARVLRRIVDANDPRLLPARTGDLGRRVRPSPSPLARLVVCHCGATMTPVDSRKELFCHRGHQTGLASHGRYVARQRVVYEALRAEAARLRSVRVTLGTQPGSTQPGTDAKRLAIEEKLRRFARIWADGHLSDAEWEAKERDLRSALAAMPAGWLPAHGPRIERIVWDDPTTLGESLRRVFAGVRLDAAMQVVGVDWHQPERRRAG